MILTSSLTHFIDIEAMSEDCEEGGAIKCCEDGFVFDFFYFIDYYLPPAGSALPWASSNIQDFIILFYGLCKTIWSPRNQSGAMAAAGEASGTDYLVEGRRRSGLRGCIFYSLFIGTSCFDSTHTYMEFLYIAWEYVGCFGRKLDTLICIIYLHLLPFWISVDIANC